MKKVRVITVAVLVGVLLTALTVPALSQVTDTEALIELFISDPIAGANKVLELAATDPEAAALILAGVAERIAELRATDPDRADVLEGSLIGTCIELIDTQPLVLVLAISLMKDKDLDIGDKIETIATGLGLEYEYLLAASPIAPE